VPRNDAPCASFYPLPEGTKFGEARQNARGRLRAIRSREPEGVRLWPDSDEPAKQPASKRWTRQRLLQSEAAISQDGTPLSGTGHSCAGALRFFAGSSHGSPTALRWVPFFASRNKWCLTEGYGSFGLTSDASLGAWRRPDAARSLNGLLSLPRWRIPFHTALQQRLEDRTGCSR